MPANRALNRTVGITELLSVESIGSTIFLFIGACLCFLVVVAAISSIHARSTDEVFGPNRRAREARVQEQTTDLCGATAATGAAAQ